MQDNNARGFYKTLFSCDKIYPIIKICAEMLNVFASYYVVIALRQYEVTSHRKIADS